MRKLLITIFFILFSALSLYSASISNTGTITGASIQPANPYSQLIGFKTGGEFYFNTFLSDWSTGIFFEDVINPWIGFEIDMSSTAIPITNYTQVVAVNPQTFYGSGNLQYIEMSGALKFYIQSVSFSMGISYNNFTSGYIIQNTINQYEYIGDAYNYFSFFVGPELTAQISSDLYTKVGVQIIYGLININPNYSVGARFYISFAYGI